MVAEATVIGEQPAAELTRSFRRSEEFRATWQRQLRLCFELL